MAAAAQTLKFRLASHWHVHVLNVSVIDRHSPTVFIEALTIFDTTANCTVTTAAVIVVVICSCRWCLIQFLKTMSL